MNTKCFHCKEGEDEFDEEGKYCKKCNRFYCYNCYEEFSCDIISKCDCCFENYCCIPIYQTDNGRDIINHCEDCYEPLKPYHMKYCKCKECKKNKKI